MSLVSRKAIQRAGPDKPDEKLTTFRKESDGTYTKITQIMRRDHKSGVVKELKRNNLIEEPGYVVVESCESYDAKIEYEDFEGSKVSMFFKKLSKEDQ